MKQRAIGPLTFAPKHRICLEVFDNQQDSHFIRKLLIPYLSSVFLNLLERAGGEKNYLHCNKVKEYMGLPEIVGSRIIRLINANGDERIEHQEFVDFFLEFLVGSKEQKMMIAFLCYDLDKDGSVDLDEVKHVLKHIPLSDGDRTGISFGGEDSNYEFIQQ